MESELYRSIPKMWKLLTILKFVRSIVVFTFGRYYSKIGNKVFQNFCFLIC
ncbi:hypothetical protein LEP1GSC126_2676 [Leptospira kirschneri str. 200801774]|nr:hypothetical protein LEP1GSC126_2676 [Leptospira kirschneri str. 200801774]